MVTEGWTDGRGWYKGLRRSQKDYSRLSTAFPDPAPVCGIGVGMLDRSVIIAEP